MAELRGLSVKVPIRFSERAQRDLYETCVAYKELAEVRGAENERLRELVAWMYRLMDESCATQHPYAPEPIRYDTLLDVHEKLRELGVEVEQQMETHYIALSIYTVLIVLATHSLTKKIAYKQGFRDGRDFERFTYGVSWGTAIDNMREDLDA